jgi:hypothetical protein
VITCERREREAFVRPARELIVVVHSGSSLSIARQR